ncbi:Rrf2 family transcriptional regulator [Aquimarina sp. LLG6339-5]|uniref:Rrf2 family transcriptional regulator n=1 Tax=Aquimarina sp. LLG6339-5 TaxID=3160830 RepID=UPI00386CA7C3
MVKSKFAIATHIMTFLAAYTDEWISSNHLASSLNINPVLVRKELIILKENNLIQSKEGKNGGVKLFKPASKIKLSDIFSIAKGDDHILSFSKNEGNPNCPIGSNIKKNLGKIYIQMDDIIEQTLSKMTLEEFKNQF